MKVRFDLLSDEQILEHIAQGGRDAFAEIVRRHSTRSYRIAYRFLGNREESEDVVQDVLLKLWQNPNAWDAEMKTKFTTWLYRVIMNRCLDLKKSKKADSGVDMEAFADERPNQLEELENNERENIVRSALKTLPKNYQAALNLSFYEDVNNKDAADIMDMTLKAFQSLLMRAKTELKAIVAIEMSKKTRRIYAER